MKIKLLFKIKLFYCLLIVKIVCFKLKKKKEYLCLIFIFI